MEMVFDEIEQNSSLDFDEEERDKIKRSMFENNRETVQSCDKRDINLILLKEVYESQKMAEMLGSKSLSKDLEQTAKRLENQIE